MKYPRSEAKEFYFIAYAWSDFCAEGNFSEELLKNPFIEYLENIDWRTSSKSSRHLAAFQWKFHEKVHSHSKPSIIQRTEFSSTFCVVIDQRVESKRWLPIQRQLKFLSNDETRCLPALSFNYRNFSFETQRGRMNKNKQEEQKSN